MATMYLVEFESLETAKRRPITPHNISAKQTMAPTGTSQQSNRFAGSTGAVSVMCDRPVYLVIGADPTADSTGKYLFPGEEAVLGAAPGDRLAAVLA
jgi:hypothetical protein